MCSRDGRTVTDLSGADGQEVLGRLAVQCLVSLLGDAKTPVFVAAVHLKGRLGQTDQAGDQGNVGPSSGSVIERLARTVTLVPGNPEAFSSSSHGRSRHVHGM